MATATMTGIGIQYDISGTGPPVLFLNGLCVRGSHWSHQRRALESRYRIITFDRREMPADPARAIPRMAGDAVALLDHLGIERAHLVGLSTGGLVAQEVALRHPDRVRSLTLARSPIHGGRLGEITHPALVVAGADDRLTPPRLARALTRALPNARFQRLPGGPGFIGEHGDCFNETLLGFLSWTGAFSA